MPVERALLARGKAVDVLRAAVVREHAAQLQVRAACRRAWRARRRLRRPGSRCACPRRRRSRRPPRRRPPWPLPTGRARSVLVHRLDEVRDRFRSFIARANLARRRIARRHADPVDAGGISASASLTLAAQMPIAPAAICSFAMAAHLCVLACGRVAMPLRFTAACIFAMFASNCRDRRTAPACRDPTSRRRPRTVLRRTYLWLPHRHRRRRRPAR